MRLTLRVQATALMALLALCAVFVPRFAAQAPAPTPVPITPLLAPQAAVAQAEAVWRAAKNPIQRLVALYGLDQAQIYVSPQAALAALNQIQAEVAALQPAEPLIAAEVDNVRAAVELRAGDAAAAGAIWAHLGEIEHWQAVGPFDNSNPGAIATPEGPENGIDLSAHYTGKQHSVGWRPLPFPAALGELNLGDYLSPAKSSSAYLVTWIRSPQAAPVALRLRDDGSTRVWVNGQLVFNEQAIHPSSGFDQHAVGAQLAAGWNEVLAKVGDSDSSDWHFSVRVTTPDGVPLQLASRDTPPAQVVPRVTSPLPAPKVADLTAEARQAAGSSPQAELDYAWVLSLKRNFNAGNQDAANAFMAAIAALPNDADAVLDFVDHDSDQSRRYRYLHQLIERDPGNAEAHLRLGFIDLSRSELWPARSEFEIAMGMKPAGITTDAPSAALAARAPLAALGLMETYAAMRVRPVAMAWAAALGPTGRQSAAIATGVAMTMQHLGDWQQALLWFQAAHAADVGSEAVSVQLANVQRVTGDLSGALATLRQAAMFAGNPPDLSVTMAQALSGLGRGPEALKMVGQAVDQAPDNPEFRIAQGEIERQLGHDATSVKDWQAALALNPQDSALRDRLRLAQGGAATLEASFERPYVQDLQKLIADYKAHPSEATGGPVEVLADTTVVNVFPSGNTGRYVQQLFRVNTTNGANSLAYYPVTYDPSTQDVTFLTARVVHPDGSSADAPEAFDQPVTQSVGYETYYDVRDKYVQMPPIRPGDFVEIAYRILPTTLESLYGDYYGDVKTFGGPTPTLFQQFVVITPSDKPLYSKAVRFPGQSDQETRDGQTVYRWTARNLPAQVSEPNAPPSIETSPYVEVSMFKTWGQFANWYTQLIRDTFVMDSEMVDTVNSLVKGKTTEAAKVDAIYRWVIQNTHYIALEFGIHGYRPYPVTEVFHRRFGDCKDKASLLIAMLHQAGIKADFVLVRTRDLGLIDPAIPSVADFDHAIVYVPNMHLYLDGTAEYNGADELPAGDQRAFVLRVPVTADLAADDGAAPAPAAAPVRLNTASDPAPASSTAAMAPQVTPEQPPADNTVARNLTGQIDANGDLHFTLVWTVQGEQAPLFRQALEIQDRQAGALQAMLHSRLPGISVENASVVNENDWNRPLQFTFEGIIPNFATVSGKTLLIPRQLLPVTRLPQLASLAHRTQDVLADPPEVLQETMHLALPPGYTLGPLPPATSLQQPFATFQAVANLNGSTLTLKSQLVTTKSLITPTEYPAYRNFWSQVDATLGQPLSAEAASAGAGNTL